MAQCSLIVYNVPLFLSVFKKTGKQNDRFFVEFELATHTKVVVGFQLVFGKPAKGRHFKAKLVAR